MRIYTRRHETRFISIGLLFLVACQGSAPEVAPQADSVAAGRDTTQATNVETSSKQESAPAAEQTETATKEPELLPSSPPIYEYSPLVEDGKKHLRSPLRYTDGRLRVAINPKGFGARLPFSSLAEDNEPINHAWGFVDREGKIVVPAIYGDAHAFSENMAAVGSLVGKDNLRSQKWGVIDIDGKVIIPLQFEWIGMFSEGLAAFRRGSKFGYIDRQGHVQIEPRYAFVGHFHSGYAVVGEKANSTDFFVIDKRGERVDVPVPWNYDKVGDRPQWDPLPFMVPYTGGYLFSYQVVADGTVRSLAHNEDPDAFEAALPFSEGLGAVDRQRGDGICEYVDEYLNVQFTLPCDNPVSIHDGRIVMVYARGSKWAVYDENGKLVFDTLPEFDIESTNVSPNSAPAGARRRK
jgi:hypothetical protein